MRTILLIMFLSLAAAITVQAAEPNATIPSGTAPVPSAASDLAASNPGAVVGGSYLLADKDNFEDKVKDSLGLTKSKPVHSRKHHRWHRRHHNTPRGKAKHHTDKGKSKVVHHDTPKGKAKGH